MTTKLPTPFHPSATDADVVACIAEVLYANGARLCDELWFSKIVRPLYQVYGHVAVDAALRENYAQLRRSVADQIRRQRNNAARLKRENRNTGRT